VTGIASVALPQFRIRARGTVSPESTKSPRGQTTATAPHPAPDKDALCADSDVISRGERNSRLATSRDLGVSRTRRQVHAVTGHQTVGALPACVVRCDVEVCLRSPRDRPELCTVSTGVIATAVSVVSLSLPQEVTLTSIVTVRN